MSWSKVRGKITAINLAGWGDFVNRQVMWKRLAYNKTMIMIIIDHKITENGRINMQNEIELGWMGTNKEHKAKWSHTMAKNRHIGGITMAVHPILGRYGRVTHDCHDPRGWGRWTSMEFWGKRKKY